MSGHALLARLAALSVHAGALIMRHYEAGTLGRDKADSSPVTDADEEAEHLILAGLATIAPGIPAVSEEAAAGGHIPEVADAFFLVDPLDGTKEFLARNGEFTVNIALIESGRPVLGIVYAPAFARLFGGDLGGAVEIQWPVSKDPGDAIDLAAATAIAARPAPAHPVGLWSRTHDLHRAQEYRDLYGVEASRMIGSSLKFCLIAAGEGDLYPRHGPTMEWDTAAGQAVLEAAGGSVRDLFGKPLGYGKVADRFKNPSFVARGR
ncbi:3'(2'),5'-bisphosphate nucleotidase CysQ [Alphaproteobacteria bacterium SO-S41]|nr:3'(2'),5'-bisphosphate nucleotidase CysQ [Alphaproteobacteria bacterium SO-S41]